MIVFHVLMLILNIVIFCCIKSKELKFEEKNAKLEFKIEELKFILKKRSENLSRLICSQNNHNSYDEEWDNCYYKPAKDIGNGENLDNGDYILHRSDPANIELRAFFRTLEQEND